MGSLIINLAKSFTLTEVQKLIFVEHALKNLALLFVQTEPHITSYDKLKKALLSESFQFSALTSFYSYSPSVSESY